MTNKRGVPPFAHPYRSQRPRGGTDLPSPPRGLVIWEPSAAGTGRTVPSAPGGDSGHFRLLTGTAPGRPRPVPNSLITGLMDESRFIAFSRESVESISQIRQQIINIRVFYEPPQPWKQHSGNYISIGENRMCISRPPPGDTVLCPIGHWTVSSSCAVCG